MAKLLSGIPADYPNKSKFCRHANHFNCFPLYSPTWTQLNPHIVNEITIKIEYDLPDNAVCEITHLYTPWRSMNKYLYPQNQYLKVPLITVKSMLLRPNQIIGWLVVINTDQVLESLIEGIQFITFFYCILFGK